MTLGLHDRQQQNRNFSSILSEFILEIISESVPIGNYQCRLETMAASMIQSQDDITLHFLPLITCGSVGGDPDKAISVTAAWLFIRLAAKLLDDVEDGESEDHMADVTNLGTGYLFAAYAALEKLAASGISYEQANRLLNRFTCACFQTCVGQDADLSTIWDRTIPTPDEWLKVLQAKSGMLFAWASWAGTVAAGAGTESQEILWEYGLRLGILVQIADDYNGIWSSPFKTDLSANHVTLPISYAYYVADNNEREILLNLLREANQGNPEGISKGRDLLSALGAQKFILAAAQVQRYEAIKTLSRTGLSRLASQKLITLLDIAFPALVHFPFIHHETNSSHQADQR